MTDRREYGAKVVGVDRSTDVAVLKIDATKLPVVRIGNPQGLKAGEWVVAIGSPFGFENSVTAGIVSAIARSLGETYTTFIQTDVAVNPGNSGGPLFNLQGEVIGINSQIVSRTGGYQGVSFAIPIDVAMNVKDQLVATGRVQRGRIGVGIQEVNQALADSFKLPRPRGALVGQVEDGRSRGRRGTQARRRDTGGRRARHRALERVAAARRGYQAWQGSDAHDLAQQVRAQAARQGRRTQGRACCRASQHAERSPRQASSASPCAPCPARSGSSCRRPGASWWKRSKGRRRSPESSPAT